MRRAAWLVAAVLAGCGGSDTASSPAPSAAPSPTPTAAPATPTATTSATATATPERTATSAPKATPKPATQGPSLAVAAYVKAVGDHDVGTLCAGFEPPTPAVCGGTLPVQPESDAPALVRVAVAERPSVTRDGRRARAIATIVTVDERGRQERRDEVLPLLRRHGTWSVSAPSPVFYRSIGRRAP